MNRKRFLGYSTGILPMLVLLNGCNGGSAVNNSNTNYGQLVSGGSIPPTSSSFVGGLAPMATLNAGFVSTIICRTNTLFGGITDALLCAQNQAAVESSPFGINAAAGETAATYVESQATASGVGIGGYAKLDAITYTSPGAPYIFGGSSTSKELVSGLVIIPETSPGVHLAESQIKGVVLYFHPTVLSKSGVPSGIGNNPNDNYPGFNYDVGNTTLTQFELAAIYASAGYIVIAPDYVGQGIDTAPVHPYVLLPNTDAISGINMVTALNQYLQESYGITLANINNGNAGLYISSYSEGGGYAMAAAQLIQGSYGNIIANAGLQLKRTVGASGAYDLTNQMIPFGFANAQNGLSQESNPWSVSPGCDPSNGGSVITSAEICGPGGVATESELAAAAQYQLAQSKPPLGTYMVNTLVTYDYTPAAYDLIFTPNTYAGQSICLNPASLAESSFSNTSCAYANTQISNGNYPNQSYSIMQLYSTVGLDQSLIANQVFFAAAATGYAIGTNTGIGGVIESLEMNMPSNSVGTFIQPTLQVDPGIQAIIKQANTYQWTTSTPISILYLRYDSTVTNLDSKSACNLLANQGISTSGGGTLTCYQIDNSQLWEDVSLGSESAPVYMNHGASEGIMQMAALAQMQQ